MRLIGETDEDLWLKCMAGNADAFGVLFDRHADAVFRYCLSRCGSWHDAEELVSITFLEAWRQRNRLRPERDTLLPWLLGVATNANRNRARGSPLVRVSRTANGQRSNWTHAAKFVRAGVQDFRYVGPGSYSAAGGSDSPVAGPSSFSRSRFFSMPTGIAMPMAMTVRRARVGQNSRCGGLEMRLHAVTAKQQIRRTRRSNRFHLEGGSPCFPGSFMP
jgi:hypothetical protein